MTHARLQEAMSHPNYLPTLRRELKRIVSEGESETLDRIITRGLLLYGNEERLKAEIVAIAEERSDLPEQEQQYLLRLAYIAMGAMMWEQRWAV